MASQLCKAVLFSRASLFSRVWLVPTLWLLVVSCDGKEDPVIAPPGGIAPPPQPAAPDRMPPGELIEGTEDAFGLALPDKMRVDAAFPESVHALGNVDASLLSKYVQERVLVAHVEVADGKFVFPKAKIRAGDRDRVYRIEIFDEGMRTKLVLRDITPPPKVEGLTERERWHRAGMAPGGQLLDPQTLE